MKKGMYVGLAVAAIALSACAPVGPNGETEQSRLVDAPCIDVTIRHAYSESRHDTVYSYLVFA